MATEAKELEIDRNYDYFQNRFNDFAQSHAGEFALLRSREIIGFFPRVEDAALAGERQFPDGLFSVQLVEPDPVDLGFFSHV